MLTAARAHDLKEDLGTIEILFKYYVITPQKFQNGMKMEAIVVVREKSKPV